MLALVSILVMALIQIVLRNVFDSGLLWAESFLRILVLWIAILGAMVATRVATMAPRIAIHNTRIRRKDSAHSKPLSNTLRRTI